MRKQHAARAAATNASSPAGGRNQTPAELVCAALVLALVALAARIASIW